MKKGFTIIELLATILIMGLLATIIIPTIGNSVEKSKAKAYNEQVSKLEKLAKQYVLENTEIIDNEGGTIYINDLISMGYLENEDVINPMTQEKMNGCVVVTYEDDKFKYKYNEDCEK